MSNERDRKIFDAGFAQQSDTQKLILLPQVTAMLASEAYHYCADCKAHCRQLILTIEALKELNRAYTLLIDSEAAEGETFAAAHFTFGSCVHSMVKPDCPSCCRSHAIRMEQQLGKLEASTALPERERIEKALREHVTHCYQVYKGVPPTVADWVGGALHYVMWGLDNDVPLAPDAATQMRNRCVQTIRALRPGATGAGAFKDAAITALSSLTLDQA